MNIKMTEEEVKTLLGEMEEEEQEASKGPAQQILDAPEWGEVVWPPTSAAQEPMGTAFDHQIGGDHYTGFTIQPFEFFYRNNIPFHKADPIKRLLRYDLPGGGGLEDLDKVIHEVEMIKQLRENG